MVGSGPHWGLDGWVLPAQATAPKLRPEPQGSGWMGPGPYGAWTVGPCQRRSLGRLLVRSQHKASPERVPTDNAVTAPLQQITSGCRGTGSGVSASNIHSVARVLHWTSRCQPWHAPARADAIRLNIDAVCLRARGPLHRQHFNAQTRICGLSTGSGPSSLAEGAIALSVTLSGGALFAS